jgi:hypothetical protein
VAGCDVLHRDEVCVITDDPQKDGHLTQLCIEKVVEVVQKKRGNQIKKIILASDGCAAQFKSKPPFLLFSHMKVEGVSVEKLFFGARHGKNHSDWSGSAIKRTLTSQLKAGTAHLRTAEDVARQCQETMTVTDEHPCHASRQFVLLNEKEVRRELKSSTISTVVGSRKLHHVRALAPGILAVQELACFCDPCKQGRYSLCNRVIVHDWKVVPMKCSGGSWKESEEESSDEELEIDKNEDDDIEEGEGLPVDYGDTSDGEEEEEQNSLGNDAFLIDGDSSVVLEIVEEGGVSVAVTEAFLEEAEIQMSSCTTYEELKEVCSEIQSRMPDMPPNLAPKMYSGHALDARALPLLKPELQGQCLPLEVEADGNCFFRSASLLLFEDEDHHQELQELW